MINEADYLTTSFHTTVEVIFLMDKTGHCLYISDRVTPVLGYAPGDLLGKSFTRFIPVREVPGFIEQLQKLFKSQEIRDYRLKIHHQQGFLVDVEINSRWTELHGVSVAVGTIRNIADQKRVEDKLHESLASYKGLFDSVSDAIYIHKEDGVFMDVNIGAAQMYGYTRQEMIGKNPELVSAPGKNDMTEVKRMIRHVLETGEPVQFQFWGRRKNGQIFPKEVILHKGYYFGEEVVITTARDITKHIQNEENLRMFKEIIDHSTEGIGILDSTGIYSGMNEALLKLIGYSREELLGQSPAVHFGYEMMERIFNALSLQGRFDAEVVSQTPNGDVAIELSCFQLIGEKGDVIRHIAIMRDISQRKKAELALRESEVKYRILAEKMHDVVWILNLDLELIYVSPSTVYTLGFSQEERMKMPLEECLVPDSLDRAMQVLINEIVRNQEGAADKHREVLLELEYYHKDGSTRWLEQSINGIYDERDELTGIMGVARDVTERRKALGQLRESAESYKGLFNTVSDAIYVLNEQGEFIDVNQGALTMYGYLHHELVGQTPAFVSADGKNDLEAVGRMLHLAYEGENQRFEFWGKRSCGDIFLKDVRLYPGVYFGQRVVIAMAQDITDRKKSDDALLARVSELVLENRKLKEGLDQLEHLKQEIDEILVGRGEDARYS